MPRMNFSRRAGHFRRGRRVYSRLSNRNVYGRKSATAQAMQIASLRNRVNKVYKACKPEKKTNVGNVSQFSMDSSVAGNTSISMASISLGCGTTKTNRIGNKVYRRDIYYITLEYFNNSDYYP